MPTLSRSGIVIILLALMASLFAGPIHSQTFNLDRDRLQMADLSGLWRSIRATIRKASWVGHFPGLMIRRGRYFILTGAGRLKATRITAGWRGTG